MLTNIVVMLLGASWKSSLIGLLTALAIAATAYAQGRSEPGWYVAALGFAALARVTKDWDKSNAPSPTALPTTTPPAP